MNLDNFIKQNIQVPNHTLQIIDKLWKREELLKGYQLLKQGSLSQKVFFIEKGLLRLYYVKDGKDITHYFFSENSFYVPIENIVLNKPYPYNLELLENSVIRTIDFCTIEKIVDENLPLQRYMRYTTFAVIKELADHLYALQFQSAQQRYALLLKKHPNILLRSPLVHIASYLNITQSTLSKIRAKI